MAGLRVVAGGSGKVSEVHITFTNPNTTTPKDTVVLAIKTLATLFGIKLVIEADADLLEVARAELGV